MSGPSTRQGRATGSRAPDGPAQGQSAPTVAAAPAGSPAAAPLPASARPPMVAAAPPQDTPVQAPAAAALAHPRPNESTQAVRAVPPAFRPDEQRPSASRPSLSSDDSRQTVLKTRPAPILRSVELAAWEKFRVEYSNYVHTGGREPQWALVDDALRPVILGYAQSLREFEDITGLTDAALQAVLEDMHGIYEPLDFLNEANQTRLHSAALNDVTDYITAWRRLLARAHPQPDQRETVEIFIDNLHSRYGSHSGDRELQRLVRLEGSRIFEEVCTLLLRHAAALLRLRSRLAHYRGPHPQGAVGSVPSSSASSTPSSSRPRNGRTPAAAPSSSSSPHRAQGGANQRGAQPGRGELRCHGCAHPGHTRRDCPHRAVEGWMASGIRRNPLRLPPALPAPASINLVTAAPSPAPDSGPNDTAPAPPTSTPARRVFDVQVHSASGVAPLRAVFDSGAQVSAVHQSGVAKLHAAGLTAGQLDTPYPMQSLTGPTSASTVFDLAITGPTGTHSERVYVLPPEVPADSAADLLLSDEFLGRSGLGAWMYADKVFHQPTVAHDVADDLDPPPPRAHFDVDRPDAAYEAIRAEFAADVLSGVAKVSHLPPVEIQRRADATGYPVATYHPRLSPVQQGIARQIVAGLQDDGFIAPTYSPYSAPSFLVPKADGSARLVVDYRALNEVTVPDSFPMPYAGDLLQRIAPFRYKSRLDLRQFFHQIALTPSSWPLTAFSTFSGKYEYRVVPFGLQQAPAACHGRLAQALEAFASEGWLVVYIDDVLIGADTHVDMLARLRAVLLRFRELGLTCSPNKCIFGAETIEFLGSTLGPDATISPSVPRLSAIASMAVPRTFKQLRAALGIFNFIRAHYPGNYAGDSAPLVQLVGGARKGRLALTDDQVNIFRKIQANFSRATTLHAISYDLPIVLRTDASDTGMGAVLLNVTPTGEERVIEVMSKNFTPTQQRWATIDKEAGAIVAAVRLWSHHLRGHWFRLESDHANLQYMATSVNPRVQRWYLSLQAFHYTVAHIPGEANDIADALSRVPHSEHASLFSLHAEPVTIDPHRAAFLRVHNAAVGHLGLRATMRRLRAAGERWRGMADDVRRWLRACSTCQASAPSTSSPPAPHFSVLSPRPFETISFDFAGPYPTDVQGNSYVILIVDHHSRAVLAEATPAADATSTATALIRAFTLAPLPKRLHSDRGTHFVNKVIDALVSAYGLDRSFSTPYQHEQNSLVERRIKEMLRHLRNLVYDRRTVDSWSLALPLAVRILNWTPIRLGEIDLAPAHILFGNIFDPRQELLLPAAATTSAALAPTQGEPRDQLAEYIATFDQHRAALFDFVNNAHPLPLPSAGDALAIGSLVMYRPHTPRGKLAMPLAGPFEIVAYDAEVGVYTLHDPTDGHRAADTIFAHASQIYQYDATSSDAALARAKNSNTYIVARISAHHGSVRRGLSSVTFTVHWAGYDAPTEEPYNNVKHCAAFFEYVDTVPELRAALARAQKGGAVRRRRDASA